MIILRFLDDRGPEKVPPSKARGRGWWKEGWIFGGPAEEADGHETGVIGEPSRLLLRSPLSPRYRFQDPRISTIPRIESCPSNATRRGLACLDRLVTHLLSPSSLGYGGVCVAIDRI